jgi:hypothetical protein
MAVQHEDDVVAAAISQHLQAAVSLMAAKSSPTTGTSINEAEIIARLDLILAKLGSPAVPLDEQLWTLAEVANYFRKHLQTVRESMACLPSFPAAIRLPARAGARSHPLYNAREVIKWAKSYQEKRRK